MRMDGPNLGSATADALGSADLDLFTERYAAALRLNQEAIEAFDRSVRATQEVSQRFAAAMESVRDFVQRATALLDEAAAARRRHPDHVIDIACSAVLSKGRFMSDEERICAALAAYQYCPPMRSSNLARAKLDEGERVSVVTHAIDAIGSTCIAHPDLRRILDTAIARELGELQPDARMRLDDRLDWDACAVAACRRIPVRVETVRKGTGAARVLESDSIADALVAAETAGLVRDVAEELQRSDPASAAAFDYLTGNDGREDVAARHSLTERQVRRAEERVLRRLQTLRRRVE
jgi:hypothetical protein